MVLKATLQKESPNQSLPKVSSEPGEVYQNKNRFFRNFPIFTAKHLCLNLFLIKPQAVRPLFI